MKRTARVAVPDERRLRVLFALFFLALAIPALLLVRHAYSQLNWQAFRQTQVLAEDLTSRLDIELAAMIAGEEARSFGDYAFLVVEGDPAAGFVQRSPLSALPVDSALPGALGYFQVNGNGDMTTPLLPPPEVDPLAYGISAMERANRMQREAAVRDVLVRNGLLAGGTMPAPAGVRGSDAGEIVVTGARIRPPGVDEAPAGQAAFDEILRSQAPPTGDALTGDALRSSTLMQELDARQPALAATRRTRTEQTAIPERQPLMFVGAAGVAAERADGEAPAAASAAIDAVREAASDAVPDAAEGPGAASFSVSTFASEIDPFEMVLLDTGHLMLFRRVWREDSRLIQGLLVDLQPFLAATLERGFRASSLADAGALTITYDRHPLATVGPDDGGVPLYQARLLPPFSSMELIYTLRELPRGPGGPLLGWVAFVLATVLTVGFVLMYRFAVGQARLVRQQQDFVSAVSHELKTPLTSIRMYGEMLKAGWTDEERRNQYYDYIHTESERLSRLIENVLQLARMTRRELAISPQPVTVAELIDLVRSKVDTQVSHAGFELDVGFDPSCDAVDVQVDRDAFVQVMINLVDNALKFAAGASRKKIDIGCRRERSEVVFTVRDFGPGVARAQMKKIFELFYRPDNSLTRDTAGTGIGLALVRQLAAAMNARVDVRNREPGAEFSITFDVQSADSKDPIC